MKCRQKYYAIGDLVKAKHCWGAYQLPEGLPEWSVVKVLEKDIGYIYVEFEGRRFKISDTCVESGWEYLFGEKWYDESDPLIVVERAKERERAKRGRG